MKYNKEEERQIKIIDKAISELVYEKTQLIKAYNYYHGKRDPEQFKHLEENYGIGTPTSIEFVPLVRKHIDVLVGEYLTIPAMPKVSCKDKDTLTQINEDRLVAINEIMADRLKASLKKILMGETGVQPKMSAELNQLQEDMETNFISQFEIAAQNIVD